MTAPGAVCKRTMVALLLFGLFTAIGASDLCAQEMLSGRWWKNERVAQRIGLSAEEADALDEAYRANRRNLIALKGKVEVEQFELETLLESPDLDEAAARDQYLRLETARTDLGVERFAFVLEVRRIVGYDRFQKLMQFRRLAKQRKKQTQTP